MKVTFVDCNGDGLTVSSEGGQSVMRAAIDNGVAGILAECGGSLACATCHVYVDGQWLSELADPSAAEDELLDCVSERRMESRLSCQIILGPGLDGIVVYMPESQH